MNGLGTKSCSDPRAKIDKSEQLEKSDLTEERDLLYLPYVRGQDSPDSSKYTRERENDIPKSNRSRHGSIIFRIKVPTCESKKSELPKPAPLTAAPEELPCISGRSETVPAHKETSQGRADGPTEGSFCRSKRSGRRGRKCEALFASWNPTSLYLEETVMTSDLAWLLEGKGKQKDGNKRCLIDYKLSFDMGALSSWPPRAFCVPEADLCIRPFVVPF